MNSDQPKKDEGKQKLHPTNKSSIRSHTKTRIIRQLHNFSTNTSMHGLDKFEWGEWLAENDRNRSKTISKPEQNQLLECFCVLVNSSRVN